MEIMVCQQNEVPRLLPANRNDAERDRGGPRAWSPSPSSPGGCRQLPWCSFCSRAAGWSLQWRVGDREGSWGQEGRKSSPEHRLTSSCSSTLPTQSWGKKLDNSGVNKQKDTKACVLLPALPCAVGCAGEAAQQVPAISGTHPRARTPFLPTEPPNQPQLQQQAAVGPSDEHARLRLCW